MSVTSILICLFCMIAFGKSIPPSLCFEPFNFDDCGQRPLHVLYYYKPGSRCEVAIWRGCPTRNMFKDEYECINTCIFIERAKPEDYHNFGMEDDYNMPIDYGQDNDTIEEQELTTVAYDTEGQNTTVSDGSDKSTDVGQSDSDGAGKTDAELSDVGEQTTVSAGTGAEDKPAAEDTPAAEEPAEEQPGEDA